MNLKDTLDNKQQSDEENRNLKIKIRELEDQISSNKYELVNILWLKCICPLINQYKF